MRPLANYFLPGELDRVPGITRTQKQYAGNIARLAIGGVGYATSIHSVATQRSCRAAVHWMARIEEGEDHNLFPPLRDKLLALVREAGGTVALNELLLAPRAHQLAVVRHRVEDLRKFPSDWSEAVAAAIHKVPNSLDRAALTVLLLTGCRPSEVQYAWVQRESTIVIITLLGAKFRPGDKAGQEYRSLGFESQGLVNSLPGLLGILDMDLDEDMTGQVQPFFRMKKKHITKLVDKIGKEVMGPETRLLPSHFRQLLASKLKAENRSQQEIAAILGHVSTRSQKYYGRARFGRGYSGVLPLPQLVEAPCLPRSKSTLDAMKARAYAALEAKWAETGK